MLIPGSEKTILAEDVLHLTPEQSFRRPMAKGVHSLAKYFPEDEYQALQEFLKRLHSRGSIVIGFNAQLLSDCEVSSDEAEDCNEITVRHSSNRVNIRCVEGFEVLGDWEEQLYDYLTAMVQ